MARLSGIGRVRRPGTLPGDHAVYDGSRLLGHTRGTAGGVIAFRADGSVLGSYPSRKAAIEALSVLAAEAASRA